MRTRLAVIFLGLLLMVTVLCYWGHGQRTKAGHRAAVVTPAATAKVASAGTAPARLASTNHMTVVTNHFAYRLSNTPEPLTKLMENKRAVLLANALIDTKAGLDLSIPAKLKATGDPEAYTSYRRRTPSMEPSGRL
jgi:hypothetical protein